MRKPSTLNTLTFSLKTTDASGEEESKEEKGRFQVEGSHEYFWYDTKKVIGVGCSASVYECYSSDESRELAVKVFNISDESVRMAAQCEIEILKLIKHENIVKFIGVRWT